MLNFNHIESNNHYPFGMMMLDRQWSSESGYRFGLNGKEIGSEAYGDGNIYDYGFRIYNPRIGKFLSVDPLTGSYPWYTPYQFAGNSPVVFIDLDGLEEDIPKGSIATGSVTSTTVSKVYEEWIENVLKNAATSAEETPPDKNVAPGASLILKATLVTSFILIPIEVGGPNGELPSEFYIVSNAEWEELNTNLSGRPVEYIGVEVEMLPDWYVDQAAERVRNGSADNKDKNLYNEYLRRRFGGAKFIEPVVANNLRNLLGIPGDWIEESSDYGNGVRFHDPDNSENYVRVMPGSPNSEFETQRQPYVVRRVNDKVLDKFNNIIHLEKGQRPTHAEDGHIPIFEFRFSYNSN